MKILTAETQDSVHPGSETNTSSRIARTFYSDLPTSSVNQEIAKLAYSLWQQRDCPCGSPEFDWLEAERRVRQSFEILR
jgi:Protein of unknown function (DUF2934)